jgi:hypothetical protein
LLSFSTLQAQTDWATVDFSKEYKVDAKIGGGVAKSLTTNGTLVNGYSIGQAIVMKGSETSATAGVHSEASLYGISREDYQKMVDELYAQLIADLEEAGVKMTNGEDLLASKYVQKQLSKANKDHYIGSTGSNPSYEGSKRIDEGSMPGYAAWAVLNDISFPPTNVNRYITASRIYGNFYQAAADQGFNIMFVNFKVTFATFDGGKGYKDVKLATKPVIAVKATVTIVSPKGAGYLSYKKDVWGGVDWVKEMGKVKDNESSAEFFGLARSVDYAVTANSEAYLAEVKAIISNLQKDIVKNIKSSL